MILLGVGDHFNKFVLEERLGGGSVGHVWRARDSFVDRIVALKIFDPSADELFNRKGGLSLADSFLIESRNLGRLVPVSRGDRRLSGFVAQVFDSNIDSDSGLFYVSQEFVSGRSLADFLVNGSHSFFGLDVSDITRQILLGLEYAHGRRVVHGDLSLHNIMITSDGFFDSYHVKIIDFGIGSLGIPTSILYLAPEVVVDPSSRSVRSDLWSVGVILYRLEHGRFPFMVPDRSLLDHDSASSSIDDVVRSSEEYSFVRDQILSSDNVSGERFSSRILRPISRTVHSLLNRRVDRRPSSARRARFLLSDHFSFERCILYGLSALIGIGYVFSAPVLPSKYYIATVGADSSSVEFRNLDKVINYSDVKRSGDVLSIVSPVKHFKVSSSNVFSGRFNSHYILFGVPGHLSFLDVKSLESAHVPMYIGSEKHFFFDGVHLRVLSDNRLFHVKAATPYSSAVDTVQIPDSEISKVSNYRIVDVHYGPLLVSSDKAFIFDNNRLLFSSRSIDNIVIDNSVYGRLFFVDGGVQHIVDVGFLSDGLLRNPDTYSPPGFDDTIVSDLVSKNFLFLRNLGGKFYLVERDGKRLLMKRRSTIYYHDGTEDFSSGDFFDVDGIGNILSSSNFHDDLLFYTSIVGDVNHDGVINDLDSRLYFFNASNETSKIIGAALKVVVCNSK